MVILIDDDCILWDTLDVLDSRATAPNTISTRRFHVYAKRPEYQGKLCEEINGQFVEIADLDGLKEGSAKIVAGVHGLTVYGSARYTPNGDFALCRFDFDVPGVYPLGLIGITRVRAIARIIKSCVPLASPLIDWYCK